MEIQLHRNFQTSLHESGNYLMQVNHAAHLWLWLDMKLRLPPFVPPNSRSHGEFMRPPADLSMKPESDPSVLSTMVKLCCVSAATIPSSLSFTPSSVRPSGSPLSELQQKPTSKLNSAGRQIPQPHIKLLMKPPRLSPLRVCAEACWEKTEEPSVTQQPAQQVTTQTPPRSSPTSADQYTRARLSLQRPQRTASHRHIR